MILPILLYEGGTHGNFLARCLSVSSGNSEKFDFWAGANTIGAHSNHPTYKRIMDYCHAKDTNSKDIHTAIMYTHKDLYKIFLYVFYAQKDANMNLLDDYNLRHRFNINNQMMEQNRVEYINQFEDSDAGTREYLKNTIQSFHKNYIDNLQKQIYERAILYMIDYSDFFDTDSFLVILNQTVLRLGYKPIIDVRDIHKQFLKRMQPFCDSEQRVRSAFDAWINNISFDLSNFKLVEQACLDYYVENHLGYEIENYIKYPSNTQDMNPVEAWEGVRYEL